VQVTTRKQTAIVGLKVRLREPLRKKLEVAAKKRGVSLNAELVARLEHSFLGDAVLERIDKRESKLTEQYWHFVENSMRKWFADLDSERQRVGRSVKSGQPKDKNK
jgi:hypothetical protein